MAGGHASSRVDSGSMKFRPVVASGRRPASSTPSRPGPSVASTPSRQNNSTPQSSVPYYGLNSGSDTDGPSTAPPAPRAVVRIAPGSSRTISAQPNPSIGLPTTPISALSTPQATSGSITSSGVPLGASETNQSRIASSRPIRPVPRPVFVAPPRPPTDAPHTTQTPPPILVPDAVLPSPPATQAPEAANQSLPGPSSPRNARSIAIGRTRHTMETELPTPPASQPDPFFPLDPSLDGLVTKMGFPMAELEAPEVGASTLVPMPPHPPGDTPTAPMPQGMDHMLPPPSLPLEEAQSDGSTTGEPSASTKKRRAYRTAKPSGEGQSKRKRRRRSEAASNEHTEDDADEETSKRPKRKRGRKSGTNTRKVVTLEDRISAVERQAAEAAEQGTLSEPLDPTNATMASLCDADLPTGRVSSKFLEKGIAYVKHVEERRKRIMERTAERLKRLRASGLDPDNPKRPPAKKPEPTPAPEPAADNPDPSASTSNLLRELGASLSPEPEPAPAETFAESSAAPQIRFVNGEMVLDEESQFYDRAAGAQQDEDSMVIVDEADSTRFSNSASFAKREGARGSRWTADETELFYWCLSAFGEDYENIARYLGRTPGQCKNKTKAEDRKGNEKRITMAIKTRIPLDLEEFGRITGRDFSGPPPEIRAPAAPPTTEQEEQIEPAMVGAKARDSRSAPSSPRRKGKAQLRHEEEEVMTLEEYERDGKDD